MQPSHQPQPIRLIWPGFGARRPASGPLCTALASLRGLPRGALTHHPTTPSPQPNASSPCISVWDAPDAQADAQLSLVRAPARLVDAFPDLSGRVDLEMPSGNNTFASAPADRAVVAGQRMLDRIPQSVAGTMHVADKTACGQSVSVVRNKRSPARSQFGINECRSMCSDWITKTNRRTSLRHAASRRAFAGM